MKIIVPNISVDFKHTQNALIESVSRKLNISINQILNVEIDKKSVDARKKPQLFFVYTLIVETKSDVSENVLKKANCEIYSEEKYVFPYEKVSMKKRPVVIGTGPAGLFAALVLAKEGYKPIVFERGQSAKLRKEAIEHFNKTGELNINSNIQFGEGGAGTFSDGKLNTGVKDKFLRKQLILSTFVEHGADPSILYMSKPHVGTDYLVHIVESISKKILELGGEIFFEHQVTDFIFEKEAIKAVKVNHNLKEYVFECEDVVLAIGHSARDTFRLLNIKGVGMEAKPFAIGLRIEHPQRWINRSQYGDLHFNDLRLPVADYKLTHNSSNGRGVYTFCMCPGGYVVNAASENESVVCNGMSLFSRDSANANSAIIVTVTPEDFGDTTPLSGVLFQENLEKKAYLLAGSNYTLPTQTYEAYYKDVRSEELEPKNAFTKDNNYKVDSIKSTCVSPLTEVSLKECLPQVINESIVEGIEEFGKKIKGFDHPKARLIGIETRTSSPVKILRNEEFMSNIMGLYPCGEGAGYAGGIMSAAIDGIKCAENIIKNKQ